MRWWADRLYKSGTTWCLWRWTDVQSEYIVRLHVLKTNFKHGLGAICLHWIKKPDPEPYDHDHPVTFLSIILRGWYTERRIVNGVLTIRKHRWFNFIRASENDCHTIIRCAPNTLTLCIMGPKCREWGFHNLRAGVPWLFWKDYYAEKKRAQTEGLIQCRKQEVVTSQDQ